MAKKIAFLTLHGMGDTPDNYHQDLLDDMKSRIGAATWDNDIHFGSVYFQKILQDPQNEYFLRIKDTIDSKKLRRWLLNGFSDAGGLEYSRTLENSAYEKVQKTIFDALGKAFTAVGSAQAPVVFIAQSLGCQVLSNYIWDAMREERPTYGIWQHDHDDLEDDDIKFRQLRTLRIFVTTGCNIPIFIGGLPRVQRTPIKRPHPDFIWENYYDQDDALGWPLQPLSNGYDDLVKDIEVNVGGFLSSWNPLSHTKYWTDKDVQKPLAKHLRSLLAQN
ncbi:MAG: hypothetical protein ACTSUD_09345 [Alphaproteobacteria bacterium]